MSVYMSIDVRDVIIDYFSVIVLKYRIIFFHSWLGSGFGLT